MTGFDALEQLPEKVQNEICSEYTRRYGGSINEPLSKCYYKSCSDFVNTMLSWSSTTQGHGYWNGIYKQLQQEGR